MSIWKKILIAVLSLSMTVCAGIALAACDPDNGNNILNPDDPNGDFKGNYEITVKSQGGLALDGIKILFYKDGNQQGATQVSQNGKVSVNLTPDVYDIVVDASDKPGYFVPAGTEYKTESNKKDVTVILGSEVIKETAPQDKKYVLGDVMYDFSFEDVDGVTYSLSDTLKVKNTVVINFWGTTCDPCKNEMPALQSAYKAYESKLELFALSSYARAGASPDTKERILEFKNANNGAYTFPMAVDSETKIYQHFDVSGGYPTTYIIDRYGVVAYKIAGSNPNDSAWKYQFDRFTNDNYSQSITKPGDPSGDEPIVRVPPDEGLEMPSSSDIAKAIGNNIAESDISFYYNFNTEDNPEAANNWPWMLGGEGDDKYLYASNENAKESMSIFYCDVALNAGDGFSFEYCLDTKSTNNALYIVANNTLLPQLYGKTADGDNPDGWKTYDNLFVANHKTTLQLSFVFLKDDAVNEETVVRLRNFRVYDAAASGDTTDLPYSVTDDADFNNGKYDVNVYRADDGLYHYSYERNSEQKDVVLFADIVGVTSWAEKHIGSKVYATEKDGVSRYVKTSLYDLALYEMSNLGGVDLEFDFGYTSTIIKNFNLQSYLINGNGYVPVTDELKDMICAFIDYAYELGIVTDERYEDQWLEFCYYFMHWGDDHVSVDHRLYDDGIETSYDGNGDFFFVEREGTLDNKVYIDFLNSGSFGILSSDGFMQYASLSQCISEDLFKDVNGKDYSAEIKGYLDTALSHEGDYYGLVQANEELSLIIQEFVEAYGEDRLNNSWKMFACYFNYGACSETNNPATGLIHDFAIEAKLGTNEVKISEIVNITNPIEEAGGGIKYYFVPDQDGVYCFKSTSTNLDTDPQIYIYDGEFKEVAEQLNDRRYDHFHRENSDEFFVYVYMKAGETYHITATLYNISSTNGGSYKMDISYVGTEAQLLCVATTGDGVWLPRPLLDEDGNYTYDSDGNMQYNWNDTYYAAISVSYDASEGVFKALNDDHSYGSTVYVDFVHLNYFSLNNESTGVTVYPTLYELATTYNVYDRETKRYPYFDEQTKAKLLEYYERAIARDKDDELYGMIEVDMELYTILNNMVSSVYGDASRDNNGGWLMFACYYEYYNAPDAE